MKIGLLVYSYTGNTLSVAQQIQTGLEKSGHTVTLERLGADNEDPSATVFNLTRVPDPKQYEALILATPVRGFRIAPIMQATLERMAAFENRKVACVVTHFFPYPFLGGTQVIQAMHRLIEAKGGQVVADAIIDWKSSKRERRIAETVEAFSRKDLW